MYTGNKITFCTKITDTHTQKTQTEVQNSLEIKLLKPWESLALVIPSKSEVGEWMLR